MGEAGADTADETSLWQKRGKVPILAFVTSPQFDRRQPSDRRNRVERRAVPDRRDEDRRVFRERRHLVDRRVPGEPPEEHLRNALQLLTNLSTNGRLHYDD